HVDKSVDKGMFTDRSFALPPDIESAPMELQNDSSPPSPTADPTRIWASALSALSGKVSAQNFELWFRPIQCTRVEGRTIHLSAPNRFIKEWFETHYLGIVLEEVHRESGTVYTASWQLSEAARAEEASPGAAAEP